MLLLGQKAPIPFIAAHMPTKAALSSPHSQPASQSRPSPHPHSPHLSHPAGEQQLTAGPGQARTAGKLRPAKGPAAWPSKPSSTGPAPTHPTPAGLSSRRHHQIFAQELRDLKGVRTSKGQGMPPFHGSASCYSKEEPGRRISLGETCRGRGGETQKKKKKIQGRQGRGTGERRSCPAHLSAAPADSPEHLPHFHQKQLGRGSW